MSTPMSSNNNINYHLATAQQLSQAGLAKGTNPAVLALILQYGQTLGLTPLESLGAIRVIKDRVVISPEVILGIAYREVIQNLTIQALDSQQLQVVLYRRSRQRDTIVIQLTEPINLDLKNLQQLSDADFSQVLRLLFPDLLIGLTLPYELKQQALLAKSIKVAKLLAKGTISLLTNSLNRLRGSFTNLLTWYGNIDTKLELEPELPEDGR